MAAVMIEDQVSPKRCGHMAGKPVISAEEMVEKIKSAVRARRDPDFVIKARTDAAGPLGLEEDSPPSTCMRTGATASSPMHELRQDIEQGRAGAPMLTINMGLGTYTSDHATC